jgi:hypothetical protein
MANPSPPEWVASDQWLVFISDRPSQPGAVDQHGLQEWWTNLRARRLDDVQADFGRVFGQVAQLLKDLPHPIRGYAVEEFEIGLAFTAEGQLAFIAKAGIEASIKLQFKRVAEPVPSNTEQDSNAAPSG